MKKINKLFRKETINRVISFITMELFIFSLNQPIAYANQYDKDNDNKPLILLKTEEINKEEKDVNNKVSEKNNEISFITLNGSKNSAEPDKNIIIQYDDVSLEIPAGSVKVKTEIIVEKLSEINRLNPGMNNVTEKATGYRFLPDGMKFEKQIKITIPYDKDKVKEEDDLLNTYTYFYNEGTKRWERLTRVRIDKEKGVITSLTNHFTDIINSTLTLPESPKPLSFNPNSIKDIKAADPSSGMTLIEPPKVNNNGSANLNYPIEVPQGRNGLTPKVAISYNSESGNDWLGLGWNISEDKIIIDTRWGVPRYDSVYETESYLLNGMQLTPLAQRGEWRERTAEKQFFPRIEGSFAKIIRHGNNPVNYWWEVTDKKGMKYYYGGIPEEGAKTEAVLSMNEGGNIIGWGLVQVRDLHGNTIDYLYDKVYDTGLPEILSGSAGVQLYLKKIYYTGVVGEFGKYSITFIRDKELGEAKRNDCIINGRAGFKTVTADLLRKIEVKFNEEIVRSYELIYKKGAFEKTLLSSIVHYGDNGEEFYRHTFDYHDDIRDGENYNGFGNVAEWNRESESIDEGLLFGNGKPTTLESSKGADAGYNVKIGVDVWGLLKAAGKFGGSAGGSKTLVKFMDIDGDSKPEPVFISGSSVFYYPNETDLNSGTIRYGAKTEIDSLQSLGNDSFTSFLWGVEAGIGPGSGSYTHISTDSECGAYFSDVNSDGLVDYIEDGIVNFNQIKDNIPTFELNSNNTPVPIAVNNNIDSEEIANYLNNIYQQNIKRIPLMDTVKSWTAPFSGTIAIQGPVKLENVDGAERDDYKTADGVITSIQRNNTVLWSKDIGADDYTSYDPDNVESINVNKGDRIFFRVQSKYDGAYDIVNWDPEINFETQITDNTHDINDLNPYRYKASEDYVYTGMGNEIMAPIKGLIQIKNTISKNGITSDDVEIELYKNKNLVKNQLFKFDEIISETIISWDVSADSIDKLELKIKTDSQIDMTKISWKPELKYVSAEDSSIPLFDEEGKPTIKLNGIYSADLYERQGTTKEDSSLTIPRNLNSGEKLHISPYVTIETTEDLTGDINFIIKKKNQLIAKAKWKVNIIYNEEDESVKTYSWGPDGNSTLLVDKGIDLSDDVIEGEKLYFYITSIDEKLLKKITNKEVRYFYCDYQELQDILNASDPDDNPYQAPVTKSSSFNYYTPAKTFLFSKNYRGWNYFAYNGTDKDVIVTSELKIDENSYHNDGLAPPDVFVLYPDIIEGKWVSEDDNCWFTESLLSSSRRGPDYIAIPDPENYSGMTAVNLTTHSEQDSIGFGVSVLSTGISANSSSGNSFSEIAYQDMNGDRFPDIVIKDKVQFTKMDGTLEDTSKNINDYDLKKGNNKNGLNSSCIGIGSNVSYQTEKSSLKNELRCEKVELGLSLGLISEGTSHTIFSLMDINGDGLLDKVKRSSEKINDETTDVIRVNLNQGYNFTGEQVWSIGTLNKNKQDKKNINGTLGFNRSDYGFACGASYSTTDSFFNNQLADINGDGLLDQIKYNGDLNQVAFNTGSGFTQFYNWNGNIENKKLSNNFNYNFGQGVYFTIKIHIWAGIYLVINPGFDFNEKRERQLTSLIDVNGDGYPDHVYSNGFGSLKVAFNQTGKTNKLKSIIRPLGGSIKLDYSCADTTYNMPHSKWVLSRVEVNDGYEGDGVSSYLTTNRYYDGYYDRLERDFYGFGRIITEARDTSLGNQVYLKQTARYHNSTYYNKGLIMEEYVEDSDGGIYSKKSYEYSLYDVEKDITINDIKFISLTSRLMPLLIQQDSYFYEGISTYNIHTYNTFSYDKYGNVEKFTDYGYNNLADDVKADIVYQHNIDKNILGLPKSIKVYGNGTPMRNREGEYNLNTGRLTVLRTYLENGQSSLSNIEYYDNGNLRKITYPANQKGQRYEVNITYDSVVATYPAEVWDSFNYVSTSEYDYRYGALTKSTDINNQIMINQYDNFGRLKKVYSPYDLNNSAAEPEQISAVEFFYYNNELPAKAVTKNKIHFDRENSDTLDTVIFIDGLKRVIQTKKTGEYYDAESNLSVEGMNVSGKAVYNCQGKVSRQGQPAFQRVSITDATLGMYDFYTVELKNPTEIEYDVLSRDVKSILPDNSEITKIYELDSNKYFKITTIDPLGNRKIGFNDIRGNIVRLDQFNNGQTIRTEYRYNLLNEITSVFDNDNNQTSITYDNFGRRTSINNPDAGLVEYFYDLSSNMIKKIDNNLRNNGSFILYDYDYNRLAKIDYPNIQDVLYIYGAAGEQNNSTGRLVSITDESGITTFEYGAMGENIKTTKVMHPIHPAQNDQTYASEYLYDYLGRMENMTYPDREKVFYEYDKGGMIKSVYGIPEYFTELKHRFDYVKNIGYDEFGQRVYIKYGNDVETKYTYDAKRRWLDEVSTTSLKNTTLRTYQNLRYTFDLVGNITNIHNDTGKRVIDQNFSYDNLYQLVRAEGNYQDKRIADSVITNIYTQDFDYDSIGNMTRKTSENLVTPQNLKPKNLNYAFDYLYDANSPHRAVAIGDYEYKYDANGNITEKALKEEDNGGGGTVEPHNPTPPIDLGPNSGWSDKAFGRSGEDPHTDDALAKYQWDEENRLKSAEVDGETTNFKYNAGGERTVKSSKYGEFIYYDKTYQEKINVNPDIATMHIFVGTTRITSKLSAKTGLMGYEFERQNTYYYHPDHIGSSNMVTDFEGEEYEHNEFTPYGETWVNEETDTFMQISYKFTSKELDEETGLYYFGARYLDPQTARWMSTDPILGSYLPSDNKNRNSNLPGMGGVFNPINIALYHYAGNNPLKYVDPDGCQEKLVETPLQKIEEYLDIIGKILKPGDEGAQERVKSDLKILMLNLILKNLELDSDKLIEFNSILEEFNETLKKLNEGDDFHNGLVEFNKYLKSILDCTDPTLKELSDFLSGNPSRIRDEMREGFLKFAEDFHSWSVQFRESINSATESLKEFSIQLDYFIYGHDMRAIREQTRLGRQLTLQELYELYDK